MSAVTIQVSKTMAHSPTRVWALLSDFGNLSWMAAADMKFTLSTSGEGANMTRHLDVDGVGRIDERLELLEPASMRLGYAIPKSQAMPFDDYHAVIQLSATGDGGSRIDWEVRFDTQEMPAADAEQLIGAAYAAHGGWIDAALSAGS